MEGKPDLEHLTLGYDTITLAENEEVRSSTCSSVLFINFVGKYPENSRGFQPFHHSNLSGPRKALEYATLFHSQKLAAAFPAFNSFGIVRFTRSLQTTFEFKEGNLTDAIHGLGNL